MLPPTKKKKRVKFHERIFLKQSRYLWGRSNSTAGGRPPHVGPPSAAKINS